MDEAGAALDALKPDVAVTYAEAGGWGRALALEARRRTIPLAGLQHGFIYRHWLNYRHETDEMERPFAGSADAGFPRPTLTLVFDEFAAQHLTGAGRFPRNAIAVTGSPRLDAVAADAAALPTEAIAAARREAGAAGTEPLVLIVSKYTEIRGQLPALLAALRELRDVRAAIKTHPAETSAPYETAAADVPNVRVLPAAAPLAPLLRAARAIVTVNSTVAIDSLVLGIPSLTLGLPNNLSPFVDAGAMAGTYAAEQIGPSLRRVLYDQEFRQQLGMAAAAVAARYRIAADGCAAERSASAILDLAQSRRTGEES
jgi:UDP-N-acetylglucosamine 2-epimerase